MGLREDMEEAVTTLQSGGDGGQRTDSALGGEEHDFRSPVEQAREETPAPPTPEGEKPTRPRDQSGKFAPRTAAKTPTEQAAGQPTGQEAQSEGQEQTSQTQAAPVPAPPPKSAPPASWSPEEKAAWATIDPKAQAAILRRDREVNSVLQQTAEVRRFAGEFQRVITPYLPMIQAEGSEPLKSIGYLLDTAAKLRTAPAPQKAEMVADMVMQFGIDLSILDTALTARLNGRSQQPQQTDFSPVIQQVREEFKPVLDYVRQNQQSQQQMLEKQAQDEWDAFVANPENPYAEEVREEMANLMMAYANMNQVLSLQDAYKLATMRHPRISQEIAERSGNNVAQLSQAARRAREASASLPSSGAPLQSGEESSDGSLTGDIMSSIRQLSAARR